MSNVVPDASCLLSPLGDAAILLDFGQEISDAVHQRVVALYQYLTAHPFQGFIEAVPAYSSLAIFYDPILVWHNHMQNHGFTTAYLSTAYEVIRKEVHGILQQERFYMSPVSRHVKIPVYYDGADLATISHLKNISIEHIVALHCAQTYHVSMLGFLPGFAYMGTLPNALQMPRKASPTAISAGSVAIAGQQTGIYPLDSPGGWYVLGHTPLRLFDPDSDALTLLQVGDSVQFYPILS